MCAGRVFHATDALRRKRWCVSSGLQEESVALASSAIADCEKRQRVVGSLSVALVEG